MSAVETAPIMSTRPPNRASSRTASTPTSSRSSLLRSTRSCSNCSVPNALTTGIAVRASVASEAISPSFARCLRAAFFTLCW